MGWFAQQSDPDATVAQFHLLGRVDFASALAFQKRLVFEAGESPGRQVTVLLCEHPDVLAIGRNGSRAHIRMSEQELARRRLPVRWVGRGGGCILHAPGQLAVYPIVPIERLGWSVGDYVRRLQRGLIDTLRTLGVNADTRPNCPGIWGRTGQLVALGIAVRGWVAYHGAFINVAPSMKTYRYIDTSLSRFHHDQQRRRRSGTGDGLGGATQSAEVCPDNGHSEKTTLSCLLAETGRAATMSKVRSQVVPSLAAAFDCDRYHLHTGHPLLAPLSGASRGFIARAS